MNHELKLTPDQMRALGYRVVDAVIEHLENLRDKPPSRRGQRPALEALLREPPPERGSDPEAVLQRVVADVFTNMMHVDHPRFFAFVPSPGNFVGAMADALVAGFNPFVGTWFAGSGPAQIELVTIDWLRQLCGLPETAGGLFVSGGSVANLTALAVARHIRLKDRMEGAVVYYSDQTHSSVERGLRVLGFLPEQLRRLPSDDASRLSVHELRSAVAADRAASRTPFCVVANAGTTNTGAVDPLPALARFCRDEGLWLHADGAYGAAAAITERGRALLEGLELCDSLSLDPHKWLFQPFEIGCVLVRDARLLKDTFRIMPEYLQDVHRALEAVNFCDYGVQLSRSLRALKLWMSLQIFGLESYRAAIDWGFELAEAAERRLRESGCWEIVTPAQLGIVSFRYRGEERINADLVDRLRLDGFAILTSTVLRGRTTLRFCTINPRTTVEDIRATVDRMERLATAPAA